MRLYEIKRSAWLKRKARRLWRWNASKWNYSWKWHKWQKARTWGSIPVFFEWWQTPLIQRMPKKRWFKRYYKFIDNYSVINLSSLESDNKITKDMELNKFKLKELWYIKKDYELVKILWNWKFSKALVFVGIDKFSKTAVSKIEKSGWTIK